jgi:hypothetical protein
MTYISRPLAPCWGFDTTYKFDAVSARRIFSTPYQGHDLLFIFRYVSLGTPNLAYDISPGERDAILSAKPGVSLGLVQHVNFPSWQGNSQVGALHGKAAVAHAKLVYSAGADLVVDMEGLGDSGAPVEAFLTEWLKPVQDAGYNVSGGVEYEGYLDGIPSMVRRRAMYDARTVRKVWSDFGHREPLPGVGFVCTQHAQTMHAGIEIDPDEARVADDGESLVLMTVDIASDAPTDPVMPEAVDTHIDV